MHGSRLLEGRLATAQLGIVEVACRRPAADPLVVALLPEVV